MILNEIRHFTRHLTSWTKPRRVWTPPWLWPAKSRVYLEPLGQVLILSPWNYPLQLNLVPLITALGAGNTAVLKPSSSAPASAAALEELLSATLPPELACVLRGGHDLADDLLARPFDFIFYTGSAKIGRKVMAAAAAHLTPVCLELGGKSPALVTADADIDLAAKRIAWGKILNAGQTCISPDYVLVHPLVKEELVARLRYWLAEFAPDPLNNAQCPRIINEAAFDRLLTLAPGIAARRENLRMAPLVLDDISPEHPTMAEEIFGPVLPVLGFDALPAADSPLGAAIHFIRAQPKPLALYLFTKDPGTEARVLSEISYGGGCVNDALLHLAVPDLPFGGVGASGTGRYHGRAGLELMSNTKSVLSRGRAEFFPRFPPWSAGTLKLFRKLLK